MLRPQSHHFWMTVVWMSGRSLFAAPISRPPYGAATDGLDCLDAARALGAWQGLDASATVEVRDGPTS